MYSYGARIDDDSNAITVIDEENKTAATTGYVNGEYVEFSGGSGSSDFSTAEVTIINNNARDIYILGSLVDHGVINYITETSSNDTHVIEAVLYKGKGLLVVDSEEVTITVSGDAELDETAVIITGDCTITIS